MSPKTPDRRSAGSPHLEVWLFRGQEKTVRKLREGPGKMERVIAGGFSPPDAVCPHSCHSMGNEGSEASVNGRERAEPRGWWSLGSLGVQWLHPPGCSLGHRSACLLGRPMASERWPPLTGHFHALSGQDRSILGGARRGWLITRVYSPSLDRRSSYL